MYTFITETPLGKMQASAKDDAICGLWFVGQKYFPRTETWVDAPNYPVFADLESWLKNYFDGKKPKLNFPLLPHGTDFQKTVWKILLEIPYGKTLTYGDIAAQIYSGKKTSSQAVGGAVGHNPISLIVPCHRVLGANGSLTGFAGGLDRKRALLELEGVIDTLFR